MKIKMPRAAALEIAQKKVVQLAPSCERVEIAGSLRRRKRAIGDIEIVAIPKAVPDMFGDPRPLGVDHALNYVDWSEWGALEMDGNKQKKIILKEGIQLDLFIVTPPAQFGWIFLLRTGPEDFSHKMVTSRSQGGLMPGYLSSQGGAIHHHKTMLHTPEEKDVFDLFELPYLDPWYRQ
jgi:DNA polymerase/3'-5' exonuclease PolX